jgi:putative flippase GtrA
MGLLQLPDRVIQWASTKFGGSQAKELERFIKFFFVGMIGFVVDFGTLNILQSTILRPTDESPLPVILATSVAFTAAITSNFIWNRYWTYPDSRSRPVIRQLGQFFFINILGWLFRSVIVILLYPPFGEFAVQAIQALAPDTSISIETQNQLGTNLAQALAVFVVMFWNFFANRYWTYNDVD